MHEEMLRFIIIMCVLMTYFLNAMIIFILGEEIGSEPTLPYLSPELTGERLLVGANFASAGIGILNDTGVQFVSFSSCNNSFVHVHFEYIL